MAAFADAITRVFDQIVQAGGEQQTGLSPQTGRPIIDTNADARAEADGMSTRTNLEAVWSGMVLKGQQASGIVLFPSYNAT